MGGLFKSKTKTTKQPFEQNPWEPQQEYLKSGFEDGQTQLDAALKALKDSGGSGVAGLNSAQLHQMKQGIGLGNMAQQAGAGMMQQGAGLTGNLNGASRQLGTIDYAAGQMTGTGMKFAGALSGQAGQAQATGDQFSQVGRQAGQAYGQGGQTLTNMGRGNQQAGVQGGNQVASQAGAIGNLSGNYAQGLNQHINQSQGASQGVLSQAGGLMGNGGVGDIVSQAGQVADNPYLQGQIDAAIGDVQRGFEQTQQQINANASGAGGMNSTRAGVMESRALEASQRQAGQIASGMRSDAYNTGLNTALQNKSQNNALLNTQLGAGQQQLQINDQRMNVAGQDLSTRLNANNQFAQGQQMSQQARNDGFAQQAQGINTGLAGYDQIMAGLSGKLQGQQLSGNLMGSAASTALGAQSAGLEALMGNNQQRQQLGSLGADMMTGGYGLGSTGNQDAFNMGSIGQQQRQNELNGTMNNGLDLVQKYMQAIGGSYGSNGYQSTTTKSASPFQQILGGVATIGGMMQGKPA